MRHSLAALVLLLATAEGAQQALAMPAARTSSYKLDAQTLVYKSLVTLVASSAADGQLADALAAQLSKLPLQTGGQDMAPVVSAALGQPSMAYER